MLGKKLLRDNGAISRWDPQLFHELRNREGERRGEGERSARINEKLDAKCPVISTSAHNFFYRFFYDSMRGERESPRGLLSPRNEKGRGKGDVLSGIGKYVVRLLCRYHESYQGTDY